ncbi:MAG: family 10 glycosylhydrolase [Lapillicoccus sp.]
MQPSRRTVLTGAVAAVAVGATAPRTWSAPLAAPKAASATNAACALDPRADKTDLRGIWIASVANIDWPSRPGLPPAQQQAELSAYYDMAQAQRYNAVVVQVRPTADAFWPSPLEPWSRYLTGTQGTDPGYDPLAYAVEQAHRRNLELHAWFNPFRVTMNLTTDVATLSPTHPAKLHPEWTLAYGGKLYFNPGVPEARAHCQAAIMDAVTRYDIDAVHFDDYFYPYPVGGEVLHDEAQYAQYGAGRSLADWRRDNINALITGLGSAIKAAKPWVKFGVSPFGVWMNQGNDPRGSATQAGAQTYSDLYADTRRWVQEEWIDYICPQIYWAESLAVADYDVLVDWWSDVVDGHDVHLYIGQATYKIGASTQSPEWNTLPQEMSNHLLYNSARPQVDGNIYFSAKDVRANRLDGMGIVQRDWYAHPALVPPMPWLDSTAPKAPKTLHAQAEGRTVTLTWRAGDASTTSYAVYRLPATDGRVKADDCRIADATHLVATLRATGDTQTWTDPQGDPGATYVVTGLDRLWNESAPQQVDVP